MWPGVGGGIILIPTLPHGRSQLRGRTGSPTFSIVLIHQGHFYCGAQARCRSSSPKSTASKGQGHITRASFLDNHRCYGVRGKDTGLSPMLIMADKWTG